MNKYRYIEKIQARQGSIQPSTKRWICCQRFFLGETSTIGGCFCGFVVPGAPKGSTERLIFVVVFGEARDRNCDPWLTRRVTLPLHHGGFI